MTFEQSLITAVSAVTGALVFLFGLLWREAQECKVDRRYLRKRIEKLERDHGYAAGQLTAVDKCPVDDCPFAGQRTRHDDYSAGDHSLLDPQ